jgi:hypothetical protein
LAFKVAGQLHAANSREPEQNGSLRLQLLGLVVEKYCGLEPTMATVYKSILNSATAEDGLLDTAQ